MNFKVKFYNTSTIKYSKGKIKRNCIALLVGSRLIKVIEVASNKIGNLFAQWCSCSISVLWKE
ncbi:hypothetical protein [Clostridium sp. VAP51]|uniref:hypothetical protein n=1 Tax=Clostridium sp. VAP51 TaxID=2949978 RepID=UPI0014061F6C|nr:hypothetical protein [Clostridium sp. VAP51]NFN82025.1 hypothetical protein [Clostridium botulinum]